MGTMIDDREGYNPPRGRFGDFGGPRRKMPCAGFADETCKREGVKKGGKLWYCAVHAPRGSEG